MHRSLLLRSLPQALLAPPGEGGGGNVEAGGGGGGGAPAFDASDLPEGLRGKDIAETYGKVKGEYFNLRNRTAEFAPPKDASGYPFEPADPIKPYFANKEKDEPWMALSRETAFKHGMPAKMFSGFMGDLFTGAKEKGLMPELYDPKQQAAKLGEAMFAGLKGPERDAAVQKAVQEYSAFAPVLADHLKLSPDAKAELVGMTDFAGGMEVLRAIKTLMAEKGIEVGGTPSNDGYSKADYEKDIADPRYDPFSAKHDKTFRAQVDEKAKRLFGK